MVKVGNRVRELLGCIDRLALAVEVRVTHSVGVEVTAVGVTVAVESVFGVGTAAACVFADMVGVVLASVRGDSVGVGVRLCL